MLGQDPPIHFRSTTAVRCPALARCQPSNLPPAPLPRMSTSYRSVDIGTDPLGSLRKEVADRRRDLLRMGFEREVSRVAEMDPRSRIVASECLGPLRQEERIVLTPYREQPWLVRPEVALERRVERDIALVVAEQVQLNLVGARAGQIKCVECVAVRRHRAHV